jgi:hypothetical protein
MSKKDERIAELEECLRQSATEVLQLRDELTRERKKITWSVHIHDGNIEHAFVVDKQVVVKDFFRELSNMVGSR